MTTYEITQKLGTALTRSELNRAHATLKNQNDEEYRDGLKNQQAWQDDNASIDYYFNKNMMMVR